MTSRIRTVPSNAKAQRREDAKPTHLSTLAEARRRREGDTDILCVARPTLSKSAGLATSLLHQIVGRCTPPLPNLKEKRGRTDVPLARRSVRRPAATDARIRRRRASHRRQAISDRLSFCLPEAEAPCRLRHHPFASLRFRVFAFFPWVGGWDLRYLRDLWADWAGGWLCAFSVSLWFFERSC
jgi:hypothetical protein